LNSYGKVRNWQGEIKTDCPFRYQGQYEDAETGLYYNRFRYYDPSSGVYLSQDPIGLNGGNPTMYGYVKDVNSWLDVFGLECKAKKIKALQEGENGTVVTVKSKKEADELLKSAFPDAQKVRGIGSQDATGIRKKHKMDEFKKKDGKTRYRKDYPIDKKTGRVYGHSDPKGTGHGQNPHINIKRSDGTMVRIDIEI
jgi:RHS repeat-associated protein